LIFNKLKIIFLVISVSICASLEYINPYLIIQGTKIGIGNELAKIFLGRD